MNNLFRVQFEGIQEMYLLSVRAFPVLKTRNYVAKDQVVFQIRHRGIDIRRDALVPDGLVQFVYDAVNYDHNRLLRFGFGFSCIILRLLVRL